MDCWPWWAHGWPNLEFGGQTGSQSLNPARWSADGRPVMRLTLVVSSLGPGGAERVVATLANAWVASGPRGHAPHTRRRRPAALLSPGSCDPARPARRDGRLARLDRGPGQEPRPDPRAPAGDPRQPARRGPELHRHHERPDALRGPAHALAGGGVGAQRPRAASAAPRVEATHARQLPVGRGHRDPQPGDARMVSADLRARTHVIPNPIPAGAAPPRVDEGRGGGLVVSIGRLSEEKGHDRLLEAFARVAATRPGWRLLIAGDGPLRGGARGAPRPSRAPRSGSTCPG